MTRPAKYKPARRRTPWWWHWGALWIGGVRVGTWPQAKARCRRAKAGRWTANKVRCR